MLDRGPGLYFCRQRRLESRHTVRWGDGACEITSITGFLNADCAMPEEDGFFLEV